MTREEAIKILEEEAEFLYGGDEPYNKIAFDMAIEALNHSVFPNSSDLISKEDVKWQIQEWINELNEAIDVLDSIPSAETPTVSEKHQLSEETPTDTPTDLISRQDIKYHTQLEAMGNGQYEEVEVAYKNDIESLPSAEPKTGEWIYAKEQQKFNFCPNCGADMRGNKYDKR